jgi:hypothetical protein
LPTRKHTRQGRPRRQQTKPIPRPQS